MLYTLGYIGVQLEDVLRALLEWQIAVLIDCRWSALSVQPGFDGGTLRRAVEGRGIAYRHLPALGSAPDLRHHLREDGDWDAFVAAYRQTLEAQEDLLRRIAGWARSHPICLLSLEHDAELGHRGRLSTRLAELGGLTVEHLTLW